MEQYLCVYPGPLRFRLITKTTQATIHYMFMAGVLAKYAGYRLHPHYNRVSPNVFDARFSVLKKTLTIRFFLGKWATSSMMSFSAFLPSLNETVLFAYCFIRHVCNKQFSSHSCMISGNTSTIALTCTNFKSFGGLRQFLILPIVDLPKNSLLFLVLFLFFLR